MKRNHVVATLALTIATFLGQVAVAAPETDRSPGFYRNPAASNTGGFGIISNIAVENTGAISFSVSAAKRSGTPGCAATSPDRWVIDAVNSNAVTALLWAVDHKRRVSVFGTGNCPSTLDIESVSRILIQDEVGGGQ